MHLLFICAGNICRSPFAEHRLRQLLDQASIQGWTTSSAGVFALENRGCPTYAIEVARTYGLALDQHRPRSLSPELLQSADLVVLMAPDQLAGIWDQVREPLQAPIWNLAEFSPGPHRPELVPDPFQGARWAYESCYLFMDQCLKNLLEALPDSSAPSARAR